MRTLKQIAALPFIVLPDGPRVLLIRSRSSGRWILPKGWPKAGMTASELASREAFEEAGVRGMICEQPTANYRYTKRLHLLAWVSCDVDIYPLHVMRQERSWPEQSVRVQEWMAPVDAARRVREKILSTYLANVQLQSLD